MREVIFIVDDNKANRKFLAALLKKEGYGPIEAKDGEEALEMAVMKIPDLILLDIEMPKKDGYQVCKELKADPRTARIPIIFLSAKSQTEDKIKGLDSGGVDYVTKPFDRWEVLARVRAHLKIARLTKELLHANNELIDKQRKLDEDLKAAAEIQRSLLPRIVPEASALRIAWRFMPCDRIGGDIFNVVPLDENHWGVYMLDVSGHGVPAAMLAVSVSQMLHAQHDRLLREKVAGTAQPRIARPSRVLETLDREYPVDRFEKFFTMSYIIIDTLSGRITYSNAGHPPPVLVRRDGELEFLKEGGTIIGVGSELPFQEGSLEIGTGDRLFLYTDGISEYRNGDGELYGQERLRGGILKSKGGTIRVHTDGIIKDLMSFGDAIPPQDDVTLLGIEFNMKS